MSKDLPYFKFFTSEWLNGDITLEDYELQGLFINICAYYWHKEGSGITIVTLEKKFRTDKIIHLYNSELIRQDDNGFIKIEFLDEQLSEFKIRKKQLSDAGIKGAKIRKELALKKLPLSHPPATREEIDKEIDKDKIKTIVDRKTAFKKSLAQYKNDYDSKLLNEFYSYWSEHGDNDKKMRYEKQTSFSIGRRLGTWKSNEKKYGFKSNIKDNRATTTKAGRQDFS